ncbi:unnamed protein product [Cladocopium goreaui]|uniref:Uncharacterized protein n=1 Tax=Cladocopium goreaui TaxID=2562237 RepID=A0A9P1DR21_9DINO|nr:unnamed protein product [Cladocopium goreaui]
MCGPVMEKRVATIMVDQTAASQSLQRIEEQLIEIREAGLRQVPLIFLCINGNGEKVKRGDETVEVGSSSGWIRVVRRMLEVPQPVYGIATGSMGRFGIMLLEACDYVYSDSLQQGVPTNRILSPFETAIVCKIAADEAELMDEISLGELKAELIRNKLFARFPKLSSAESSKLSVQFGQDKREGAGRPAFSASSSQQGSVEQG